MKRKFVENTKILTSDTNKRRMRFMPGLLSEWLKKRIGTEHGDAAEFARQVKEKTGVVLRADELSDFQRGARVSQGKLKKLVAAFSGDRSAQASLLAQYMLDQVPAEFRRLVEMRESASGGAGKVIERELDEAQRTLADAERLRDEPAVAATIRALGITLNEVKKLLERTK